MDIFILFIWILLIIGLVLLKRWSFNIKRKRRKEYYRQYLKSDAWKRKRYVVLKRDNWTCQYCGGKATEVHHKKYARRNIGKEPIKWLVSICRNCHQEIHKN
jgi:5-methylcytosine-specific restriction endonuclease McrA